MKRLLLPFLLFALCAKMTGETVRDVRVSFNKDDFSISITNKIAHISTNRFINSYGNDLSSPALPHVCVNLLIGPKEDLSDFSYSTKEQIIADDILIAPCPKVIPTNIPAKHSTDKIALYSNDTYPKTFIEFTGSHIYDGYKCLSFIICPFRYDNIGKKLYFENEFNLKLSLRSNTSKEVETMRYYDDSFINNLVVNPEDMKLYDFSGVKELSPKTNNQYEYAIITNNNLKSAFQKLAKWKTLKGIKTTVLTVENICNSFSGNSQQIKIKKALKNLYDNNSNFKYVLLAGDVNVVPAQMCLVKYIAKNWITLDSIIYENYCPTDLYFSCFGTMDWDSNGNGLSGEIGDNVNISPNIAITRAPVNTVDEAETFVNRIISYESAANAQTLNENILMCGNMLDSIYLYNGIQMSDTHYKGEKFYNDFIANIWDGSKISFYDTGTDLPGGSAYNFIPTNIRTELEKGYTFVNVDTHGGPDRWMAEYSTYYDSENADEINNPRYSFIVTSACLSNAFDSIPNCLSEAFIRNANSGIIAYFGCSRYGWHYDDKYSIAPSSIINGNLFNHIFTDSNNNYGEIVRKVKISMISLCNSYYDFSRWLLFGLNPIGDPEMPIFTSVPQTFTNVTISFTNGTLNVNSGVSDCKICVSSANDMGDSYFDVRNGTSASYSNLTDEYYICITKKGYIPYFAKCGNTVYMQDESINSDYAVFSNQTIAGNNVTATKPNGPVEIKKGKTTIKGTNGVTISNSFEVKTGASLEIKTN